MPTHVRPDTGGETNTKCRNCGAHVSPRFVRVFGNNEDELYRCLECTTLRDLQRGAGSTRKGVPIEQLVEDPAAVD